MCIHPNAFHLNQDGNVWMQCSTTGRAQNMWWKT